MIYPNKYHNIGVTLPVCDAFNMFREITNTGDFHEYDMDEVIRAILDSITYVSGDIKYAYFDVHQFGAQLPLTMLSSINSAIKYLTDEIKHFAQVFNLYANNTLTHQAFEYNDATYKLTLYPKDVQ